MTTTVPRDPEPSGREPDSPAERRELGVAVGAAEDADAEALGPVVGGCLGDGGVEGPVNDDRVDAERPAVALPHGRPDDVDRRRPAHRPAEVARDPGDEGQVAFRAEGVGVRRVVVDGQVHRQRRRPPARGAGQSFGDVHARAVHHDPDGARRPLEGEPGDLVGEIPRVKRAVEGHRAAARPPAERAGPEGDGGRGVGRARGRGGGPDDTFAVRPGEQAAKDDRAPAARVGRVVGDEDDGPPGGEPREPAAGRFDGRHVRGALDRHPSIISPRISRSGTETSQPG